MTKRIGALLLVVQLFLFSCNPTGETQAEPGQNDLLAYELKGNVKEVKESHYEATNLNDNIEKGNLIEVLVRNFTPEGLLIEEATYNAEGDMEERIVNFWNDSYSVLHGTIVYDSDNNMMKTISYEYDSIGNLVSNTQFDSYNKRLLQITNFYDENNYLTQSNDYTGTGYLGSWKIFTNDEMGRLLEEYSFEGTGELVSYYILDRDENGNIIEGVTYDSEGTPQYSHTNEYDQHGNLTAWVGTSERELYNYEYDSLNNWIRKEVCLFSSNTRFIIEREIYYY